MTRFKPIGTNPNELQRCREGLLALLADKLRPPRYQEVTIVFDASQAAKHLPQELQYGHLRVLFAREENSADDAIDTILQHHSLRQFLVVVSSDHRVQNAARRRRAVALDADVWMDAMLDHAEAVAEQTKSEDAPRNDADSPKPTMSPEDTTEFLEAMKQDMDSAGDSGVAGKPDNDGLDQHGELHNPFPDGYFDDLDELDDR